MFGRRRGPLPGLRVMFQLPRKARELGFVLVSRGARRGWSRPARIQVRASKTQGIVVSERAEVSLPSVVNTALIFLRLFAEIRREHSFKSRPASIREAVWSHAVALLDPLHSRKPRRSTADATKTFSPAAPPSPTRPGLRRMLTRLSVFSSSRASGLEAVEVEASSRRAS